MIHINRSWNFIVLFVSLLISTIGCSDLPVNQESPDENNENVIETTNPNPSPSATPTLLPEPVAPIVAVSLGEEPNQSDVNSSITPAPLDKDQATEFLDIRGVGDAAMANTHQQPLPATFGEKLDAFDPTGKSYRGDLSFINWETTVGDRCNQFWAPLGPSSFAFMSHPDNLGALYQRGFNLIGLANNHTRDCPNAEDGQDGAKVSANHLESFSQESGAEWLWHGVGAQKEAQIRTLNIKGREVKVAFANIYLADGDCTYVTCRADKKTVLRSLRDADADIRILSIHSWTAQTQQELVNTGVEFIQYYDGDVVFGHGPHVWKPVRVVESPRGKKGVLFESLGNFIHPALLPRTENIVGRALFNLDTFELGQVQVIPIAVSRVNVSFANAPNPTAVPTNLTWQLISDPNWQSGVNPGVKGAYSNIK